MIYHKDLPKFENMEEAFRYKLKLDADKKYKLPYFSHAFRSCDMWINDEVVKVLLSTWRLKNTTRNVDFNKYSYSIIETFQDKYTIQISKWGGEFPKTKFIEGYTEIPSIQEIDKLVKTIDW